MPTRGATCRCASVSESFLHRNCVLSVPPQLTLTVVLSKCFCLQVWKVWTLYFWRAFYYSSSCQYPPTSITSMKVSFAFCNHLKSEVEQSHLGVKHCHSHSWTSSCELTNWLIKQNVFYLLFSPPVTTSSTSKTGYVRVFFSLADRFKSSLPWCALAHCCSL